MALNPILTTFLGYLILNERPSKGQIIAFPLGIMGVAIVVLGASAHLEISMA